MPGRRRVRALLGVLAFIIVALLYTRKSEVETYGGYVAEKVVGGGSVLRPKPVAQEPAAQWTASMSVRTERRLDETTKYKHLALVPATTRKTTQASSASAHMASSTTTSSSATATVHQLPPITADDEPGYEIGEGRKDNAEIPQTTTSAIHWVKQTEHFPISTTRRLPTGTAKPLPKIQYSGHDAGKADVERLAIIKEAAQHAWNGYRTAAWGMDEVKPISGGYNNPFNGWGATLVDSLDTLWMMGMKEEFEEALEHVRNIDFTTSIRSDIPLFETTIRYVGGLVGAYDISGAKYPILLEKAIELAEVLYSAFDTPNRLPQTYYRWKPAFASQPHRATNRVVMAELGSLSLEFTRLAQLTGEPKYYDAIARITDAFEEWQNNTRLPGMWPTTVDASGCAKPAQIAFDSSADQQPVPGGEGQMMVAGPPVRGAAGANMVTSIATNVDREQRAAAQAKLEQKTAPKEFDTYVVKRQLDDEASRIQTTMDVLSSNATSYQEDPVRRAVQAGTGASSPVCLPQGLASTNKRATETFTLGGQSDSTYEYLPKQHMLLGGLTDQYKDMYIAAADTVSKYLLFRPMNPDNLDILLSGALKVSINMTTGEYINQLVPEGEHLTCFAGGMFALGGKLFDRPQDIEIGRRLTDGCVWAYESTTTGIMPELFTAMTCEGVKDWREECKWNETAYWRSLDPWEESRTRVVPSVVASTVVRTSTSGSSVGAGTAAAATSTSAGDQKSEGTLVKSSSSAMALQTAAVEGATRVVQKVATSADEFDILTVDLQDDTSGPRLAKRQLDNDPAVPLRPATPARSPSPSLSPSPSRSSSSSSLSPSHSTPNANANPPLYTPKPPLPHPSFVAQKIASDRLPPGITHIRDRRYILRPEAIESVFYLYRITNDPHYREVGWKMFLAISEATRVVGGYGNAAIDDVTKGAPEMRDSMESFWTAETLKYFWLLFAGFEEGSLDEWVFNTEAHAFRRPGRGGG
ncbi:hypothetical protein LTR91_006339 [Friedmanniomyces endolithicus]|uniref:alpha-1,2-Mannosidase n=1 Tax=Friedmanniomyces endolithicus TaxID=329885 RepID=A0AAN6FMG7_9PEZI|nr:hypothetical protein LTS00_015466 [Friedmanniomyces endolithicus]KAK0290149.1 hypothetical protein LTR35_002091 [Friedmanniomyces endolithicus]KAK0319343.1 hypothetical protein LTR82_009760 [Friedmanniomyces endolithicus]KAK0893768.1 hypothetical protein LTR57_023818 [Friedmanniomyces endolithicus]KAK0960207.1 hypothetical protein LTS01_021010 [Friedmanniomyces endolithicus]